MIILFFFIFTGICIDGCLKMKIYYNENLDIDEEYAEYDYFQMSKKYFNYSYKPVFYVKLDDTMTDFFSEEAQLKHI